MAGGDMAWWPASTHRPLSLCDTLGTGTSAPVNPPLLSPLFAHTFPHPAHLLLPELMSLELCFPSPEDAGVCWVFPQAALSLGRDP